MLAEAAQLPRVQEMLAAARDILGYDLLDLAVQGE
jgi:hypothetical protein